MRLPTLPGFSHPSTPAEKTARVLWIAGGVLVAIVALLVGLSAWSSSPSTCARCHEIAPSVESWRTSPHANVGCPACHEPVRAWYDLPASLVWRAQMYQHDLAVHNAKPNASALPTTGPPIKPIKDENCLECHDLSRAVTLPKGVVMDHAKHVERNRSCVSCHRYVGHPPSDVEAPLLLMDNPWLMELLIWRHRCIKQFFAQVRERLNADRRSVSLSVRQSSAISMTDRLKD